MTNIIEGGMDGSGIRVGIAVSRFNDFVSEKLLGGAMDCLLRHGVAASDIVVARVPGAFELPLALRKMAASGKHDAVICLGTVIRGATDHYHHVASEVTKGVAQVMMETGVPVAFGALTVDNLEQAIDRAGGKAGNKGWDAAMAAIEMANLLKKL
ncbi:MAG: 6,7-dimethyl-8-ribityllumazine synthase [Nitrospinota bacterium]|nr:6,7-dimethyl-8-ribityllumazine synthase [Nitrospinota bacterium]MDH5755839.1 6,7-dimethyl-8-ribityllumazine synthase [Nitrospinota bacterium]